MKSMNRRSFLKGGLAAMAAAGTLGALSACAPQTTSAAKDTPALPDTSDLNVVDSLETEIVIVGGGVSGIAAAVQACENGDSVTIVEWGSELGGAGVGVEGMFGWNSPLQIEQNITFDPSKAIAEEVRKANYLVDANAWTRLVSASADNIQWLLDNGVEFSGVIDTYPIAYPDGTVAESDFACFHWFGGGSAYEGYDDSMAGGSCYRGYVLNMEKRLEEYGATVLLNMQGTHLVFDENGKVAGVYAKNKSDEYTQINAKAVIVATGGILNDAERLRARGINPDRVISQTTPGSSGDGARMCIDQAGAREYFRTAYEGWNGIPGDDNSWTNTAVNLGFGGPVLWVNEYAERYTNENAGSKNFDLAFVPRQNFRESYAFVSKSFLEQELLKSDADLIADWNARIEQDKGRNVWQADSLEELAEGAGLDPETFVKTVNRYNELCESGTDSDFMKDSSKMIAQTEAPYVLYALNICLDSSFGDVVTDRYCRAVNTNDEPIDGLYAIGVEGCMLYSNVYTIDMPGSGCANSINSGRVAANHAHEYIA